MTQPPAPPLTSRQQSPNLTRLGVAGAIFLVVYIAMLVAGGALQRLALSGLETLPFVVLAVLAYLSRVYPWMRPVTVLWLAMLTGVIALYAGASGVDALPDGAGERSTLIWAGCTLGLAAGWLCYLPAVRRAFARVTPLDPQSFVHATALVLVVAATLVQVVPLAVVGEPPLLVQVARDVQPAEESGNVYENLYGLLWLVPAAVVAVGYPITRSLPVALARLGLVRPTRRQLIFAVLAGAGMVVLFIFIDLGIARLWEALGWPTTDSESVEELFADDFSLVGAVVIGITAGLGEELGVRGVLQPRLGLLLSNLFFTALHALQYNFDGLASVFLAGLIFGLIRQRTNTTTSAIVHGLYDFILITLSVLAAAQFR